MFLPVDTDANLENLHKAEEADREKSVVQTVASDFQDRYKNALQDENGNTIEISPLSADQAETRLQEYKHTPTYYTLHPQDRVRLNQFRTILNKDTTAQRGINRTVPRFIQYEVNRSHQQSSAYKYELYNILVESDFFDLVHVYIARFASEPWKMDILTRAIQKVKQEKNIRLESLKEDKDEFKLLTDEEYNTLKNILFAESPDFSELLNNSVDNTFYRFAEDPAYQFAQKHKSSIESVCRAHSELSNVYPDNEERTYIIARNLYFQNAQDTPSQSDIAMAIDDFLENRNKYAEKPIFKDRHNYIFASDDKIKRNGHTRFATDKTIAFLRTQSDSLNVVRSDTIETNYDQSVSVLKHIYNAPVNSTFVFSLHGTENGNIVFANGMQISPKAIGEAFSRRMNRPDIKEALAENPDILVFTNCFNHSTYRKIIETIQKDNHNQKTLPIGIMASEYGQSYKNTLDENENHFFKDILHFDTPDHVPTFQDIFENEFNTDIPGNPSVYIPKNGTVMQIAVNRRSAEALESGILNLES